MMDERQRVVRDLIVRLEEVGIRPDRPFAATFIPGRGWTFSGDAIEPDAYSPSPSPSASSSPAKEGSSIALSPRIRPSQK